MAQKILIVDDEKSIQESLAGILGDEGFEPTCSDSAEEGLARIEEEKIDLVLMDIWMPGMDGIDALKRIKETHPHLPVIMISGHGTIETAVQATRNGAFDFIEKPESVAADKIKNLEKDLINKVLAAISSKRLSVKRIEPQIKSNLINLRPTGKKDKVLVIASSTGGPQALKEVVPYLPEDIPAKILIIQHMPEKFTEMFAQRLDKMSKITVKEAKAGDTLTRGQALLAPGNYHMTVTEKGTIALNQEPTVLGVRPCADLTIASAAQIYQKDIICVILTGMGHDGTMGASVVKKYGGYCIAEHESTCIVYGMPKSVVLAGLSDEVVPLHKIAESIVKMVYS